MSGRLSKMDRNGVRKSFYNRLEIVWRALRGHMEGDRPPKMKTNSFLSLHPSNPLISFQFIVYTSYFAAISLLFTVRGMYTLLDIKRPVENNQAERATNLPEPTRLWRPSRQHEDYYHCHQLLQQQQNQEKNAWTYECIKIFNPSKRLCGWVIYQSVISRI